MEGLFGQDIPQLLSIITNLPGEAFGLWFSPVLSCIYIAIKGAESDFCSKPAALSSNDLSHFGNGMAACANRVSCQKRRPILLISSPAGAYAPQIITNLCRITDTQRYRYSFMYPCGSLPQANFERWTLNFEFWTLNFELQWKTFVRNQSNLRTNGRELEEVLQNKFLSRLFAVSK